MLKLKRYSTIYNSLLLLSVFFMLACGPGLYDENEFPGFFMPQSAFTPVNSDQYYYSPAFLYVNMDDYWANYVDENLQEWKAYCKINISDSLAGDVIYEGSNNKSNPFYRELHQRTAAWRYLLIARRIQNASAAGGDVWNPTPADTSAMKELFHQVTDSLKTVNDPFLKGRYAYQAIKLADELLEYDSCIALYNHYFGNKPDTTLIKWWSFSRKGGALLRKGDTAQAVYVFSQVFANSPSMRDAAYLSLRLYHISFVPAALQYCKNDEEMEAVYALCAIQPWQDALPLMKAIIKINPNQSFLELIMAREINKNERYYYDYKLKNPFWADNDTIGAYKRRQQSFSYFKELGVFAKECAANPNIKDYAFWNTAASYIFYIEGDYKTANVFLTKASKEPTNNLVLPQQIQLQKLLLLTADAKQMTPELEKEVLPILFALKNSDSNFYKGNALAVAGKQLAYLYKKVPMKSSKSRGWLCNRYQATTWAKYAPAKSWLLILITNASNPSGEVFTFNNYAFTMFDTTSFATMNNLITYFCQSNPSAIDKQIMQIAQVNIQNVSDFGTFPNYLYFIKGQKAISSFDYKEAIEAWKHLPDSFWSKDPFKYSLTSNPFVTKISDIKKLTKVNTAKYTPYQIAVQMQRLTEDAKNNPVSAAKYYYLLGCGAYNMSYYGNSWILVKQWRSGNELAYGISAPLSITDSMNYYTTNMAETYFAKALKSAGTDKELAARACFMAAKCEQNQFYIYIAKDTSLSNMFFNVGGYISPNPDGSPNLNSTLQNLANTKFHHYFNILKDKYSATQFNKEVIRECATYRDFVEGK